MLSRIAVATAVLLLVTRSPAIAAERDHLCRGEKKLTADYEIEYDRAIRHVLSRGWRQDVVIRTVDKSPFEAESVAGIARTPKGYAAFETAAPGSLWYELGLAHYTPKHNKKSYQSIKPLLHERALSEALAVRIAALWRRVLTDPRNYWKDRMFFRDHDQFTYYVSFLPHEHLTAYGDGWGPHTEELARVKHALADYAEGAPEKDLVKAVKKAETKLGI